MKEARFLPHVILFFALFSLPATSFARSYIGPSPPVPPSEEADVTGILTAKPDFSPLTAEGWTRDPTFVLRIVEIHNYKSDRITGSQIEKEAVLTVTIAGTPRILKAECEASGIIEDNCYETDPEKVFGSFQSYKLAPSGGDTIRFKLTCWENLGCGTDDGMIGVVARGARTQPLRENPQQNSSSFLYGFFAGVVAILTLFSLAKLRRRSS